MLKDEASEWRTVTSGVAQASVLAPIMFIISVNDITEKVKSYTSVFADDAKLPRKTRGEDLWHKLLEIFHEIQEWRNTWDVELNEKKCDSRNRQE